MQTLEVSPAPRLYIKPEICENLGTHLHTPYLKQLGENVINRANTLVRTAPIREGEAVAYQRGTRDICNRLEVLTGAWCLTRHPNYRVAALRHLDGLTEWNQISCEANPLTPADPILPFCLSYGELSAVVGVMYDLFQTTGITPEEFESFKAFLDKFLLKASLRCLESPPWWANKEWSNWNGVCAGGMGIMALAFYNEVPDAQKLIPFVETSLAAYVQSYVTNGGGCHEGTGYWNYGMNYAMRYFLSWENATGQQHQTLSIPELAKSLFFPLDFTGITFGDNDGWGPTAFYFLLAERLNQRAAAMNAAVYLQPKTSSKKQQHKHNYVSADLLYAAKAIPDSASMEKLREKHAKKKVPVARVYEGMDWAALSDDEAFPTLRMAVRGGSSKISGHGMLDLLSIRCRVNGELMITDQQDGAYMDTTFSKRGTELYGRSAASKSTLFVDGLGCRPDADCARTEVVKGRHLLGIRIEAGQIYLPRWKNLFIGRLVLMVDNAYWLVIDAIKGANTQDKHWIESRFHTSAEADVRRKHAKLSQGKQKMQISFGSLQESTLRQAVGMPSQPLIIPTTIMRWMSSDRSHDQLQVTALVPGNHKAKLAIKRNNKEQAEIKVDIAGQHTRTLKLSPDLYPAS